MQNRRAVNQIKRIQYYEKLLNEASAALAEYGRALEAFAGVQEKIRELQQYYTSPEWKADFEASEKGELPEGLLCGVLSKDGIDHILDDNRELLE